MRLLIVLAITWVSTMADAATRELPHMENPALSPDGRHLAYLARDASGRAALERLDLDRDDARHRVLDEGAVDGDVVFDACGWGNAERLVCSFHGRGRADVSGLLAVDADGGDARVLVRQVRAGGDASTRPKVIDWENDDDPRSVLVALYAPGEAYPAVQRLDLYTGALETVVEAQAPIRHFILDGHGEVRFGWGEDRNGTVGAYARLGKARLWRGLRWERLTRFAPASGPDALRPVEGQRYIGGDVTALGRDGAGGTGIWHIDITDQAAPKLMSSGLGECRPILSPRGRLLGLAFAGGTEPTRWMDGRSDNVVERVGAQLPGAQVSVLDYSDNPSRYIVQSMRGHEPPRVHLYGIAGGPFELRELGRVGRVTQLQAPPPAAAPAAPTEVAGPSDAEDLDLQITVIDPGTKAPVAGLPIRVVLSSDEDWRAGSAGKRYVTDALGRVRDTLRLRTRHHRVGLDIPLVTHAAVGFEIGLESPTDRGMPLLYTLTLDEVKKARGTLISATKVYTRAADGRFTREVDLDWHATSNDAGDVYTMPPRDTRSYARLPDPPPFRLTHRNLQLLPHPRADGTTRWALDLRLTRDPYRPREGG